MIEVVITIITFLLTVFFHVIIHRALLACSYKTFKTIGIFIVGFFMNAFIVLFLMRIITFTLPLSVIILYGLFSLIYILLFTSPYLEDLSPTFAIFLLIRRFGPPSMNKIRNNFSDKTVIIKRLNQLVRSGQISQKNSTYTITPLGRRIIRIIDVYRKILGWDFGG